MESLLIVPSASETEWLHELLPELSPIALPIAGRRFFDYALESAQRFGFVRVGVLDWHYSEDIAGMEGFSLHARRACRYVFHFLEGHTGSRLSILRCASSLCADGRKSARRENERGFYAWEKNQAEGKTE